jgi:hypothetical protein
MPANQKKMANDKTATHSLKFLNPQTAGITLHLHPRKIKLKAKS